MEILIVGFGKMGMLHAATLKAMGVAERMVICDPSPMIRQGLKAFGSGMEVYGDLKEALGHCQPGMAVVAAPNHAHFQVIADLAVRGIPIFVEKPFVAEYAEAERIVRVVEEKASGAKIMVGHCLRFSPTVRLAEKILSEGTLGSVRSFQAEMFSSDVEAAQRGWRFAKNKKGGGVLLDLGSHLVDLVRSFFGMPEEVSGYTEKWVSKYVEDFAQADFYYKGFSGNLRVSWSMPNIRKPTPVIWVFGENGALTVSNDEVLLYLKSAKGEYPSGYWKKDITQLEETVPFDLAGPYYTKQLVEFVDAVRSGKKFRNGIHESLEDHRLIHLIGISGKKPLRVPREDRP